ncbi:unnamed protein product [Strongylus vulgaris]|uniref:Uncharacterized protein n=1 Tax=Strongylus vulgaris TaxID=40348 RepID=A0A3P7IA65_STRVU|nr:unnamed protein product [Strongylus vulgaris]
MLTLLRIGTNWLSGEERSRLEAVQRDWRLSRPYNANATNRPWIRARHREQQQQQQSPDNKTPIPANADTGLVAAPQNALVPITAQTSIFDRTRLVIIDITKPCLSQFCPLLLYIYAFCYFSFLLLPSSRKVSCEKLPYFVSK